MKGIKNVIRQNKLLRWLLLMSNWLIQSIPNLDRTERFYKIAFSVFFTIVFYLALSYAKTNWILILFFALISAHTLNWLINGHIAAIFIHRLFIGKTKKEGVYKYLLDLEKRVSNNNAICYCAVYGGIARGLLKESSDIDIAFVREPGFINAVSGLFFLTKERIRTNLKGIAFEGYLIDSLQKTQKRFNDEKVPIILKQSYLISQAGKSLKEIIEKTNCSSF